MAKRSARAPVGVSWIVTWPLLFVFAAIVFLCADELRQETRDLPTPIGGPDWEARLAGRVELVTAALEALPLGLSEPLATRTGSGSVRYTHRLYKAPFDPGKQIETQLALDTLRSSDLGLTIATDPVSGGVDVKLGLDGLLTHTVQFREKVREPTPPRVVLVVDGLGEDLRVARLFAEADAPFALGVWPFRPFSKEVAELARVFRREAVLRVGLSTRDTEDTGGPPLLILDGSIASQLDVALAAVPDAVAVMADLDADLRSDPQRAKPFVAQIQQRELLYVASAIAAEDSAPGAPTVGIELKNAVALHLDAEHPDALAVQADAVIAAARRDGTAVAVVQPQIELLAALQPLLAAWRAAGVEIVPLSSLRKAPEKPRG